MGLNERRKIKELQDETFPGRVKEIQEICGVAIPYEVDWDSLADDADALNFIDNISCHRLNMALRVICQDDMGKAAVRQGLKKNQAEERERPVCKADVIPGGRSRDALPIRAADGRNVQRRRDQANARRSLVVGVARIAKGGST